MKKIFSSRAILSIPLIILLSSPALTYADDDDVLTVDVIGTRPVPGGISIHVGNSGVGVGGNSGGGSAAAREANIKKAQCLKNADETGKECNGAYAQLNSICSGFVGALSGMGTGFLLAKIGLKLTPTLQAAITMGSGSFNTSKQIVSCSVFSADVTAYCANGVAKMKAGCS